MSDLLSVHLVFIVLPYKPVASQIYLYPQCSACIIDNKAKTLDDTKVHNWGYVPNTC